MPNPFSKLLKKDKSASGPAHSSDSASLDGGESSGEHHKPDGALKKFIKGKIRIKLSLKKKSKKSVEDEAVEALASELGLDADDGAKKGKKKEKKKKEKKAKEPKPQKAKKTKEKKSGDKDSDAEGKKKFPILWIIIGAGAVLLGVAGFLIYSGLNSPTVEELLTTARNHIVENEHDKAEKIYKKLVKKDETLVQAYLGLADIKIAAEDVPGALEILNGALEPTENSPLIQAKIDALSPESSPPAEPSPDSESASEPDAGAEASGESDSEGDSGESETSEAPPVVEEPIVFTDASFEKMLRMAIAKPSGDIIASDLSGITSIKILGDTHAVSNDNIHAFNKDGGYEIGGVLYSEKGGIKSLGDIKHLKNLTKVTIAYNSITDISGIEELTKLETVGLYFNDIGSIAPLASLKNLRFLYIYGNQISDLSPLAGLTKLDQLWLNENKITDISAVKGLSELTELVISNNGVSDISPISGLSKLGFFYADRNNISNISALKDMKSLTNVSLIGNSITDFSPASNIRNVKR